MSAQATSYEANALRVEGQLGGVEIYRGSGDNLVGRPGVFRGLDLVQVVSASPNAVAEARVFRRHYPRGILATSFGIAALGLAHGVGKIPDLNWALKDTPWFLGIVSTMYGTLNLTMAFKALSKSIWWYNRDLAATR